MSKASGQMTLQQNRAKFVRRVWEFLSPPTETYEAYMGYWVPEKLLPPGGKISGRDLGKINLSDPNICLLCFAKIHRHLCRNWYRLAPELAIIVERSLNELGLWEGFDPSKIAVSDQQRDFVKVRFDIADVLFAEKRAGLDQKLKALSVNLETMLIFEDAKVNEPKIIEAVRQYVATRAHIDLSIATIQNIPRSGMLITRIARRLRDERERYYDFLRDILVNSTWWRSADGQKTYLGSDDASHYVVFQMQEAVRPRLAGYENALQALEAGLEREVPPKAIIEECSEIMRGSVMPTQNITTNINVTNSQVGVLNTGTIQDVQSIDASISMLKSKGDIEVSDAFKKITEGIVADDTLAAPAKAELLSNLKFVSEMAAKKQEERNPSVVKSVLRSISEGISVGGPAVKALLPLVPLIAKFFGF